MNAFSKEYKTLVQQYPTQSSFLKIVVAASVGLNVVLAGSLFYQKRRSAQFEQHIVSRIERQFKEHIKLDTAKMYATLEEKTTQKLNLFEKRMNQSLNDFQKRFQSEGATITIPETQVAIETEATPEAKKEPSKSSWNILPFKRQ